MQSLFFSFFVLFFSFISSPNSYAGGKNRPEANLIRHSETNSYFEPIPSLIDCTHPVNEFTLKIAESQLKKIFQSTQQAINLFDQGAENNPPLDLDKISELHGLTQNDLIQVIKRISESDKSLLQGLNIEIKKISFIQEDTTQEDTTQEDTPVSHEQSIQEFTQLKDEWAALNKIKQKSSCPYAKKAIFYKNEFTWRSHETILQNIVRFAHKDFIPFIQAVQNEEIDDRPVDSIILQAPGKLYGENEDLLAKFLTEVLEILNSSSIQSVQSASNNNEKWKFEIQGIPFFIVTLAPFYKANHCRYNPSENGNVIIVFQTQASFKRILPRNREENQKKHELARKQFAKDSRPYPIYQRDDEKYVKPVDSSQGPIQFWKKKDVKLPFEPQQAFHRVSLTVTLRKASPDVLKEENTLNHWILIEQSTTDTLRTTLIDTPAQESQLDIDEEKVPNDYFETAILPEELIIMPDF